MAGRFLNAGNQELVLTGYGGVGGSTNRTVCFWHKSTYISNGQMFGWGVNTSNQLFECITSGSLLYISTTGSFRAWNLGSMFDNTWHWYCLTFDGTRVTGLISYLDNTAMSINATTDVADLNTATSADVLINHGQLVAGWYHGNNIFYDFRIYNRALPSDDRDAIYDDYGAGRDGIINGLETKLLFGTEAGTITTELDLSGNGNDGDALNTPDYVADPFNLFVSATKPRIRIN